MVPISGEVSVAAIQSERITPQNSLVIEDYYSNYKDNIDDTIHAMSATGLSLLGYSSADGPRDYQYVVTDKVKYLNDVSRTKVLLPYEYQPKYDHYDTGTNPSGRISICYENGDIVQDVPYTIEYTTSVYWEEFVGGAVTERYDRDLIWYDSPKTTRVHRFRLLLPESICYTNTTYYVRYNRVLKKSTTGGIDMVDDVSYSNMEIINPQPIYAYDLDYEWNAGDRSIDVTGGSKLTEATTWVKRSDLNRIRVLPPNSNGREGWFPRIWAGSFTDHNASPEVDYEVTEILGYQGAAVDWSVGGDPVVEPRCATISHEEATILNSRKIKLIEYPLYFTNTGYPNYIPDEVYDGLYNTSVDPDTDTEANTGITILKNDTKINNVDISDWDLWNSTIVFNRDIQVTDKLHVTYLYRQMYYSMQKPDLCPQVHHTKPPGDIYLGENDSIVVSILPSDLVASNKSIVWYYKHYNPTDVYNGSRLGYDGIVLNTVPPTGPTISLAAGTIKLADLSIRRLKPESLFTIYDTRIRGGGIIEDSQIQLLRVDRKLRESIQEESNYYSDIGLYDGQGLKKDGVLIITIPLAVLSDMRSNIYEEVHNITLDEAHQQALVEVNKIISNNIALGMYYIIVDENGDIWPPSYSN